MDKEILDVFSEKSILIVGDTMIDRYLWGKVNRISPEAPVPVLNYLKEESRIGGAANVALNAINLGCQVSICSIIGKDKHGQTLKKLLEANKISNYYLHESEERCTSVKTRVLSGQQHLLRVDQEDSSELFEEEYKALRKLFLKALDNEKPDAIIIQDYNKGLLTKALIAFIIEESKKRGLFIAVDPKRLNFLAYKNVDLFKPNLKELSDGLQRPVKPTIEDLSIAAEEINGIIHATNLMVTLSEHGIFTYQNNTSELIPTKRREIVDVCGAGDAVIAIATLALISGFDLGRTAVLSNIAGGQVCEKVGVSTVNKEKIALEYLNHSR